jgi:hypothetical protein
MQNNTCKLFVIFDFMSIKSCDDEGYISQFANMDYYVWKLIYISKGMWCQKWEEMIYKEKIWHVFKTTKRVMIVFVYVKFHEEGSINIDYN